jgi:hypothetical protein
LDLLGFSNNPPLFPLIDLRDKVLQQQEHAQQAREWKETVAQSKQAAVDDLARNIEKYRKLGLEFEPDEENESLRYVTLSSSPSSLSRQESHSSSSKTTTLGVVCLTDVPLIAVF